MPISSNTFGTFLNTFSTLERERSAQGGQRSRTSPDLMLDLVRNVGRAVGEKPLADVIRELSDKQSAVLPAVMEAREQGLIALKDRQDETFVSLTPLGKAFLG